MSISGVAVQGDWAADICHDNLYGIQISTGATGVVFQSVVSGNNYTGTGEASSAGILVYGGGASCSGGDPESGLVRRAGFLDNTLINNDIGIALFNLNSKCNKPAPTPTQDLACNNTISNSHGYPNGVAAADANTSGRAVTSPRSEVRDLRPGCHHGARALIISPGLADCG